MSSRDHIDPLILVSKLDKLLNELTLIKKDSLFRKQMMDHLQGMCILTLLEYGSKVPKLEYVLKESSK